MNKETELGRRKVKKERNCLDKMSATKKRARTSAGEEEEDRWTG